MKKQLIFGATLLASLSLTACQNHAKVPSNPTTQKQYANVEAPYFQKANQQHIASVAEQMRYHEAVKSLRTNYKTLFGVASNDQKQHIKLDPRDKSVKNVIKYAKKHNKQAIKSWNNFAKGVNKTSENLNQNVKSKHITISILDPTNKKPIYTVKNGKTLYNKF